jgi:hypothetical protein
LERRGFVVTPAAPTAGRATPAAGAAAGGSPFEARIRVLKGLLSEGVLSAEQFAEAVSKLV